MPTVTALFQPKRSQPRPRNSNHWIATKMASSARTNSHHSVEAVERAVDEVDRADVVEVLVVDRAAVAEVPVVDKAAVVEVRVVDKADAAAEVEPTHSSSGS